ncbi:low-density lipoprotein receptor-related protein 1B-like isoform X2 [Dysidea avara]|uniref:low-density lipoprotein receptor-related protein 1B-like isoform X2 n=1 Tax=Dysidea avara TaxID=196820 RepID=UPI0033327996
MMMLVAFVCVIATEICVFKEAAASVSDINTFCLQRRCPYDGYFRCKVTRRCIRPSYVCDRYDTCGDGSDEENCGLVYLDCREGHGFHCDNGTRCISHSSVCNGYRHCIDGADEHDCLSRPCPYDGDFKCNDTGVCLRSTDVCNGYSECQYRYGSDSDYDEQNCASRLCPYDGDYRCGDNRCIRSAWVCNRYNNCRDGSDEINCSYSCPYDGDIECNGRCYRSYQFCDRYQHCYSANTVNCSSIPCPYDGDFRCQSDGACVRSYEVCDDRRNCYDGSDEENCTSLNCIRQSHKYCNGSNQCISARRACYYGYCGYFNESDGDNCYDCGNSTMLSRYRLDCDGIYDCADGQDEKNCYERECFALDDFRCNTTGACIRKVQVCDGILHCTDGSDEMNCLLRDCPIPGDVKCPDNGSCIHSDMVCDGVDDCMDGSDETNCSLRACPYPDDRRCSISQACIRAYQWCNNVVDCGDGMDEEDCYDIPCPYDGDFRCYINGACVRAYDVCDRTEECLDGSDEGMNYCPEEVVMGIVWERSLTNTTYKHKCSDIHPSFKLADMAIRECMKNRSWAPVDMSQCVMVVNSPVVMILVVTLNADNSSEVQSVMDQITSEVKEKIIQQTAVTVDIVPTTADVSLKITYEFDILTTDEIIELVKYEINHTTIGNFSISTGPNLTIFESTDVCHCPIKTDKKTIVSGVNVNSGPIELRSVCSGKPCSCDNNSGCECTAPFVGNGMVCGRDSDGDGYADTKLDCDDPQCEQDICAVIYNPDQNMESCTLSNATKDCTDSDEDRLTAIAAVGITFILTLILSTIITLLIVCLVHKKKGSTKKETITVQSPTAPSTAKCDLSVKNSDVYEIPDNFIPTDEDRYQRHPGGALQKNPAYDADQYNTIKDAPEYEISPVYENLN